MTMLPSAAACEPAELCFLKIELRWNGIVQRVELWAEISYAMIMTGAPHITPTD